jgi:hypothetical protein
MGCARRSIFNSQAPLAKLIMINGGVMMRAMKTAMRQQRPSAWDQARAYGVDMSQLAANLRKRPAELLQQHQRALAMVMVLRAGAKKRHA